MKVYTISRAPKEMPRGVVICTVTPEDAPIYPLPHVLWHSPDGFETGYGGSGPAELALSILADYFQESRPAVEVLGRGGEVRERYSDRQYRRAGFHHQSFKWTFIAPRPLLPGQSYTIKSEEIEAWLKAQEANEEMADRQQQQEQEAAQQKAEAEEAARDG